MRRFVLEKSLAESTPRFRFALNHCLGITFAQAMVTGCLGDRRCVSPDLHSRSSGPM